MELMRWAAGPPFLLSILEFSKRFGVRQKGYLSVHLEQRIEEIIEPAVQDLGFEIVRVQLSGDQNPRLQIMAEMLLPVWLRRMLGLCRQAAAFTIGYGFRIVYRFVRSARNWADGPSRGHRIGYWDAMSRKVITRAKRV